MDLRVVAQQAARQRIDRRAVANIDPHKAVARIANDVGQALEVAGVGQHVEVDHVVVRVLDQEAAEVGADEAGAAGD